MKNYKVTYSIGNNSFTKTYINITTEQLNRYISLYTTYNNAEHVSTEEIEAA